MQKLEGKFSAVLSRLAGRHGLAVSVLLSLAAGVLYAASLPPWDLIDEEQHVHYVQYLVERHELPAMGTTHLSREIVDSAFQTDRWRRLGLPRPPTDDPKGMGLEGLSYEAYQPPLFYVALTVPYALLPDDMLAKLYGLRLLTVVMGTLSVAGSYALVRMVWPQEGLLAFGVAAVLALVPERAMAVSRVNNDALAELAAVVVLLLLARCAVRGFGIKTSGVVGLAMGLALLSKVNTIALIPAVAVVWAAAYGRVAPRVWLARGVAISVGVAGVSGWFFYRNMAAYGDLTGISGFTRIVRFSSTTSIEQVLAGLGRGFWAIWRGPVVDAYAVAGGLAFCAAVVGLAVYCFRGGARRQEVVMILALAAVVLSAFVGVWAGAIGGWVPLMQGRLVLPAYAPALVLVLLGIFKLAPPKFHRTVIATAVSVVAILDAYVLLYLLPYQPPLG